MNGNYVFLVELLLFSGVALAWGFYELRKTNADIEKRKAEETAEADHARRGMR